MGLLFLLTACNSSTDTDSVSTPSRVVVMSDTHAIGPQYVCCSESDDLDNASIMRTVERLGDTVRRINEIEPPPEHVFILGDIVHDARVFATAEEFEGVDTAWSRASELLGELRMPYTIAWGNHDYDFSCGDASYDRELTHALFERYFDMAPYTRVDLGAWTFLAANSQLGPTFDLDDPRCDGGLGSFGAEQLAWLSEALAEGRPSVVLTHHYDVVIASDEDPTGLGDFGTVLAGAPDLQVSLAGHAHRWLDFQGEAYRQIVLGSTRYDSDNFWLLDLDPDGDGYTVLDQDKAGWYTTCATTWTYDGTPAPEVGAVETGDCQ